MRHVRSIVTLLVFVWLSETLTAQRTAYYSDPDQLYKTGIELFDKKQYNAAQKSFVEFAASTKSQVLKADAQFYAAACAYELFHKDGEWQMKQFIEKYPWSTKISTANLYLGKSNYRKKKYAEAIKFFEAVDTYKLSKEDLAELRFKRGYSYFVVGNDEKAKSDFFEIKDVDNKYAFAANYYYSHIAYKEKNYEIALQGFNRLVNNETFGRVVPYYITQIYFIQGKFDKVTREAPKLLNDTANIQKESEINRMIGESYFNLKDYTKALTWLKKTELGSGLNTQGNYVLGYCHYKNNDFNSAVANFQKATDGKDTLAQNAWYHLGDCYIRLGEKVKAKNAFYAAYQLGFSKTVTEDALFSFAKLSYELDFSPYNEAVKGLSKYLQEYPQSPRREECYNILINVYSTTKNYQQAITSIESLGNIDPVLKYTYQKLIYFKAVEHFNNNELDDAEKQFRKAMAQNSDFKLNALCQYWLAEISYIRKDYSTAIDAWKKFQLVEGATQLSEYDLSNYALGYAYFQRKDKEDYTNANISFRKFLLTKNQYDVNKTVDANIRVADSYFMNRDFLQASDYYKIAIGLNKLDVDYALYQKALCDGLSKKYRDKIEGLQRIEKNFPASGYMGAALNEIADTYYNNLKENNNAIVYYEKILKNFPTSSYVNNCYAQLGNIYFFENKDDKAFEYYDKFVKLDTRSEAAKNVLEAIKKIFNEKGDIEGMEKYFASIGNPLSETELEKDTYFAAYKAYYEQKSCDLAMPKWETYISKFPQGKYIAEAQFCYAECAYNKNLFDKALPGYLYVIERPRSIYSETALSKVSYLYYKEKKYQDALPVFLKLQELAEVPANKSAGRLGAMRCAYYLKQYETSLTESAKVLNTDKLTPQQTSEAKYIKARSLFETGRLDDAMLEFKAMTKTARNLSGAEAYYYIASIYFSKKEYKEVEKTVNKLVSYEYSNDDWNNKGMLLLADAYIAKGDLADAKVILETVVDGKPKQEFVDEANKRLKEIEAKEEELQRPAHGANPETELKLENKQTANDSLMYNNLLGQPEGNTQSTQPTTEQPK